VELVADAFPFDGALRARWAAEALKWACCAASRHGASRSHQVYAALAPALSAPAATALLAALATALARASAEGLSAAVELLSTLRALAAASPPGLLPLYPHLLAAALGAAASSVVRVGELALALAAELLDAVDLSLPAHQLALLCVLPGAEEPPRPAGALGRGGEDESAPPGAVSSRDSKAAPRLPDWPLGRALLGGVADVDDDSAAAGPWLAAQQLMVKGLFQPDTEAPALAAMAAVAAQVARAGAAGALSCSSGKGGRGGLFTAGSLAAGLGAAGSSGEPAGLEACLGDARAGLAIALAAALPWLAVHAGAGELAAPAAAFARAHAAAAAAVGWRPLGRALAALAAGPPPAPAGRRAPDAPAWLPELTAALAAATCPAYARLVVARLAEAAARAAPRYRAAALAALEALFEAPGLDLGAPGWLAGGSRLVELLAGEVGGPRGPRTLAVLRAAATVREAPPAARRGSGAGAGGAANLQPAPPQAEWRQCMDDLGEVNKVCAEALRRVAAACPGAGGLARAAGAAGAPAARSPGERLLPFLPSNA
jgi:hypothetical protein